MKKISILCAIIFVVGIITSSVLAIDCTTDEECTEAPLFRCSGGQCVACIEKEDCADDFYCNGDETCVDNICSPGISPCGEDEICDEANDACVMMAPMDIKPGSCQNPLNVRSKGVLSVAILGTDTFDVTTIDPEKILIAREGFDGIPAVRHTYEDMGMPLTGELCACDDSNEDDLDEDDLNQDGYMDLILKFRVPALVEGLGLREVDSKETIQLTVMGETDAAPVMGKDCVQIINKLKWWQDIVKKPKKPKTDAEE